MEDPLEETNWMDFQLCCMFVTDFLKYWSSIFVVFCQVQRLEAQIVAWQLKPLVTPLKVTWNINNTSLKKKFIFQTSIFWGFNPENGYKDGDPVSTNNKISWGTNKVYLKTNHFYFSLFGQVAFQGRTYSGTENWVDDVFSFTRLGYVSSFPGECPHLRTWQNCETSGVSFFCF